MEHGDLLLLVEEIGMDGSVSLGRCSRSTLYRWAKLVNEHLAHDKYPWRVKPDPKTMCLDQVPADTGQTG